MYDSRILSVDRDTQITTLFHYDPETDTAVIEKKQDVSSLLSDNKAIFNGFDERSRWKDGLGDRVASIPLSVYFDLQRKGITEDQEAFRTWLNNPDNRFFRTRPGRI